LYILLSEVNWAKLECGAPSRSSQPNSREQSLRAYEKFIRIVEKEKG
jgi:hypothetical protein